MPKDQSVVTDHFESLLLTGILLNHNLTVIYCTKLILHIHMKTCIPL